ncbi:MAG: G5 domain-containing protein [Chloroflexota bacterium]
MVLVVGHLVACNAPQAQQGQVTVNVLADGQLRNVQVAAGSTVQEALAVAKVTVNTLDRSEPPFYTIVSEGTQIRLTRVTEEFSRPVEEVIPFERQEVRSESLPEGQMMLSQRGVNGLRRITYRRIFEEGQQVSDEAWESVVVQKPVPEIVLIGIGQTFTPVDIPGRIAYLLGGNAWVMDTNTGIRRLAVKSADLDGHVFELSPDGRWLLFSRRSTKPNQINTLWLARVDQEAGEIALDVANVIHFAAFRPQEEVNELISYYTVGYSTVEPRTTAPGWQANNDLAYRGTNPSTGYIAEPIGLVDSNSGGAYGWWGTSFAWGPNGTQFAYAGPDAIGIVRLPAPGADEGEESTVGMQPLLAVVPLETGSDWAWVPGIAWGPDGNMLYAVTHDVETGVASPDRSPLFDLVAIPAAGGAPFSLVEQVGMFAYPAPSPLQATDDGSIRYQVAYLQAITPRESQTSLYRLAVMDRDGSNRREIFPPAEARGLEPQQAVWSPRAMSGDGSYTLLVLYQGNLWFVNSVSGEAQQLTSDGLSTRVDWK